MTKKSPRRPATPRSVRSRAGRARTTAAPSPPAAQSSKRRVPPGGDDVAPVIVGVGASAGGLEAFTAMLRTIPADVNLAIVFVQHLAPQHESGLVTLLTGQSALPVIQADRDMRIEPNQIGRAHV